MPVLPVLEECDRARRVLEPEQWRGSGQTQLGRTRQMLGSMTLQWLSKKGTAKGKIHASSKRACWSLRTGGRALTKYLCTVVRLFFLRRALLIRMNFSDDAEQDVAIELLADKFDELNLPILQILDYSRKRCTGCFGRHHVDSHFST